MLVPVEKCVVSTWAFKSNTALNPCQMPIEVHCFAKGGGWPVRATTDAKIIEILTDKLTDKQKQDGKISFVEYSTIDGTEDMKKGEWYIGDVYLPFNFKEVVKYNKEPEFQIPNLFKKKESGPIYLYNYNK